ncbi:MAG: hypothetical protein ACIAQU_11595, partial [Phycisphaerales bacterium JB064]
MVPRLLGRRALIVVCLALAGGLAVSVSLAWLRASLSGMGWAGNDWVERESEAGGIVGVHPVPASGTFGVSEIRTTGATDRRIWWGKPRWAGAPPFEGDLPRWSLALGSPPPEDMSWPEAVEREYGWPKRCLRVSWGFRESELAYPGEALRGGILIEEVDWGVTRFYGSITPDIDRTQIERHRALPLIPIW